MARYIATWGELLDNEQQPDSNASVPYIDAAIARAGRRKSAWNLLLIPFVLLGITLTYCAIVIPLVWWRDSFGAPDAFAIQSAGRGDILLYIPPLFASIGFGMVMANVFAYLIPPMRRALHRESAGHAVADFRTANRELLKFSVWIFLPAYTLSLIGSFAYLDLAPSGVHYRGPFGITTRTYTWDDISKIQTKWSSGSKPNPEYSLVFRDGFEANVMSMPRGFEQTFTKIQLALRGRRVEFDCSRVDRRTIGGKGPEWVRIMTIAP